MTIETFSIVLTGGLFKDATAGDYVLSLTDSAGYPLDINGYNMCILNGVGSFLGTVTDIGVSFCSGSPYQVVLSVLYDGGTRILYTTQNNCEIPVSFDDYAGHIVTLTE